MCYQCVTNVLPMCYRCVTSVLPMCYRCATSVSGPRCFLGLVKLGACCVLLAILLLLMCYCLLCFYVWKETLNTTTARQFVRQHVVRFVRHSVGQKASPTQRLEVLLRQMGSSHHEVTALHADDLLKQHKLNAAALNTALSKLPTWTPQTLHDAWGKIWIIVRDARASHFDVVSVARQLKDIRSVETREAARARRIGNLALRKSTGNIHKRGMPSSLYLWLGEVTHSENDEHREYPLPVGVERDTTLTKDTWKTPLQFFSSHPVATDIKMFLGPWLLEAREGIPALITETEKLHARQGAKRCKLMEQLELQTELVPESLRAWFVQEELAGIKSWARPTIMCGGTCSWWGTRLTNYMLAFPQFMLVLQGSIIVHTFDMDTLHGEGCFS